VGSDRRQKSAEIVKQTESPFYLTVIQELELLSSKLRVVDFFIFITFNSTFTLVKVFPLSPLSLPFPEIVRS
jgi:hypothetical protein